VYPALLAPVHRAFGPDLEAFKAVGIFCFLGFLAAFHALLRARLAPRPAAALTALAAFHPAFWDFKDHVYSDVPFLFFVVLALAHFARSAEPGGRAGPAWKRALLGGVLLYLPYGARTAGVALAAAFAAEGLLRRRFRDPAWLGTAGVFAALAVLQNFFLHSESGYVGMSGEMAWDRLGANVMGHAYLAASLFDNGFLPEARRALFIAAAALAAGGYADAVRRGPGLMELFPLFYAALLCAWPADDGFRYIFPLVPFLGYFAARGLDAAAAPGRAGAARALGAVLALGLAASYAGRYARADFGPVAGEFYDFVRGNAGPEDLVVFRKPRALAYFTGRRAMVYHEAADDALWADLAASGATLLAAGPFRSDREFFAPFLARRASSLEKVFSNAEFEAHRIVR
jgi:hypothetical protein